MQNLPNEEPAEEFTDPKQFVETPTHEENVSAADETPLPPEEVEKLKRIVWEIIDELEEEQIEAQGIGNAEMAEPELACIDKAMKCEDVAQSIIANIRSLPEERFSYSIRNVRLAVMEALKNLREQNSGYKFDIEFDEETKTRHFGYGFLGNIRPASLERIIRNKAVFYLHLIEENFAPFEITNDVPHRHSESIESDRNIQLLSLARASWQIVDVLEERRRAPENDCTQDADSHLYAIPDVRKAVEAAFLELVYMYKLEDLAHIVREFGVEDMRNQKVDESLLAQYKRELEALALQYLTTDKALPSSIADSKHVPIHRAALQRNDELTLSEEMTVPGRRTVTPANEDEFEQNLKETDEEGQKNAAMSEAEIEDPEPEDDFVPDVSGNAMIDDPDDDDCLCDEGQQEEGAPRYTDNVFDEEGVEEQEEEEETLGLMNTLNKIANDSSFLAAQKKLVPVVATLLQKNAEYQQIGRALQTQLLADIATCLREQDGEQGTLEIYFALDFKGNRIVFSDIDSASMFRLLSVEERKVMAEYAFALREYEYFKEYLRRVEENAEVGDIQPKLDLLARKHDEVVAKVCAN